jgi:hypothetical protein
MVGQPNYARLFVVACIYACTTSPSLSALAYEWWIMYRACACALVSPSAHSLKVTFYSERESEIAAVSIELHLD